MMLRDYRPPIRPQGSERLLFRRWDEWRPSNSLRLRGQVSCLLHLLSRLPLRTWGTLRFHCRVRAGQSQEVPEDGSLFNMSPLSPGFLICPSGAAGQHPEAGVLLPSAFDGFDDSVLGDPIAYAQCEQIPGSDTPLTLPVYTLPSGLSYMPGQSSVQTVLASGVSSLSEGWSSATAQSAGMAQ